jgi:hypothetical protein
VTPSPPQVRAPVDGLTRLELLRRHEGDLALDLARLRGLAALQLRDAEVEDLHGPVAGDHDVVGADVAVDHAAVAAVGVLQRVRGVEPGGGRGHDAHRDVDRDALPERPTATCGLQERESVDVLHGDEVLGPLGALALAEVEDRHDVGVVEPRASRKKSSTIFSSPACCGSSRLTTTTLLKPAGPSWCAR